MSCNSLNASINDVTSEVHVPRRGFMRAALLLGAAALLPAAYVGKSLGSTNLPKVRAMRLPPVSTTADAADQAAWLIYRTRFIAPEGRVVDTGNGGVSHSEGQGYAMLFATWTNDRPSFERLWNWTHAHLSRPSDALHAWRWDPRRAVHVEDLNSATDGDLMIAWALLRGAERWDVPQWRERGLAIGRDILAASTREVGERTYLLPAPYGFDHDDRLVLNPSHYVFPAMRALAAARPDPRWAQLERDGLWLMESARFGEFDLPADYVQVDRISGAVSLARGWPEMFSWNAVRVPLHLAWAGETDSQALQATVRFWKVEQGHNITAWADLRSSGRAPYSANGGIVAVATLGAAATGVLPTGAAMPDLETAGDYYAGSLMMLSRMAMQEGVLASRTQAGASAAIARV